MKFIPVRSMAIVALVPIAIAAAWAESAWALSKLSGFTYLSVLVLIAPAECVLLWKIQRRVHKVLGLE